jgi:putative transposase
MRRKLRIEYDGAIYHVIQRGNNREYIFGSMGAVPVLLDLLTQYLPGTSQQFYRV